MVYGCSVAFAFCERVMHRMTTLIATKTLRFSILGEY